MNKISDTDECHNATKPMLANRLFKFRGWGMKIKWMSKPFSFGQALNFHNQIIRNLQSDDIVMQFTGLIDKNGIEIYEGDIVTYRRSIGNWTGEFMTTTHKIIFTEEVNAFVMEYGNSYIKLRKHWGYEYEVLGNLYENPELLTQTTS